MAGNWKLQYSFLLIYIIYSIIASEYQSFIDKINIFEL